MKTFIGIIICSSILFISAAVDQDIQDEFSPLLDVDNPSMSSNLSTDSSPTEIFVENPLISEREISGIFKKKYTNSTHKVSALTVITNTWKYFKNGVLDHQKNGNITEKVVPIDIDRTPSLLPQQPNKIWTLAGSRGVSITVQLSAKLTGTNQSIDGLDYISPNLELPGVNETHVTGNCAEKVKAIRISWASHRHLKNNSIKLFFKKQDNDANIYYLQNLYVFLYSQYVMEFEMIPELINNNISDCNGVDETCSYSIDVKETDKIGDHELTVHLIVDDIEFHITDTNEFNYALLGMRVGFVLVILIGLTIYKRFCE
ncbi:uncharacterized protein LOC122849442 [Aphidius gifuensis]|uniref:uncharacterized protein LOC122849442 n=1 Tax=Aphidius gifuensis TaxID=684658 RepID=UPI001CDB895D|nr:uncharacterized protein LOC122849442 [Aphidius gifuensis]